MVNPGCQLDEFKITIETSMHFCKGFSQLDLVKKMRRPTLNVFGTVPWAGVLN